jgi:transmembrane sensor
MEPQDQVDHKAIRDQASLWLSRLDSGSADIEAFERWRDADPAHAAAFAKISRLWSKLGDAGTLTGLKLAEPAAVQSSRRAFLRAASVVGAAAVVGAGAFATKSFARSTASTLPGERRRVSLGDGVAVELNTDSKISWRRGARVTEVWLERGEAALIVPPSVTRPCTLNAGAVTADLGTGEFNARLRGGSLNLLVLRGAGALHASGGQGAPATRFSQGQSVLATASRTLVQAASSESVDDVSAWRRGEIVFQGAPLGAVVEEYNRYLIKKMVIADPELSKLRLGGRFINSDPTDFLATLRSSFDIDAVDAGGDTIMLTRSE